MKSKKIDWLIFAGFVCLTFFLRFPAFFQSGIGPDESIYLLMARSLTEGKAPYTEFFDNKPIGIYVVFALALLVFGKSVLSIRIAAWIAVSITSFLLYRIGKVIGNDDHKVGLLAGTFYSFLTLGSGGISSDTEIFFAPFVVFAFSLLFFRLVNPEEPHYQNKVTLLIIGLLMGIALQIKQVVLFEFIGIVILVGVNLYSRYRHNISFFIKECFKGYIILVLGFFTPFICVIIYYILNGHFDAFAYANFSANLVRVGDQKWSIINFGIGFLIQVKTNLILWIALCLLPLYWLSSQDRNPEERKHLTYLIIWFAMAFLGVCAPKSFYVHYFLQLLPSLCLLSSYLIIKTIWSAREIGTTRRLLILALILVTPLLNIVYPYLKVGTKSVYFRFVKGISNWGDDPAIVANYLKKQVKSEDYIYVVDYLSVIYFLVPAKIPTKYAYPPFLNSDLAKVAGSNPVQELRSILAKKPVYIIKYKQNGIGSDPFYKELEESLKKNYAWEKEFIVTADAFLDDEKATKSLELYRLKPNLKK
jgi:4-amino-4-deoxy-L-arabinose transferase-like glycosyltransferase